MSDVQPRLMLVSPALDSAAAATAFGAALTATLDALPEAPVEALLLRGGGLDDAALGRHIAPLVALAQARGIAVLLEDRPELLAASGADGLHVTLGPKTASIKELRRRFGAEINLGAGCGASRHLAMTAGEQGADYIAFGGLDGDPAGGGAADPELVAWWEAVMTPPQVALGAADLDQALALAAAGPDFLAIGPTLWISRAADGGSLAALLDALAAAASAPAEPAPEGP